MSSMFVLHLSLQLSHCLENVYYMFSSTAQDRFETLVPALSKYGAVTVGITLMVIGASGLYETLVEHAEAAAEPQIALAGSSRL